MAGSNSWFTKFLKIEQLALASQYKLGQHSPATTTLQGIMGILFPGRTSAIVSLTKPRYPYVLENIYVCLYVDRGVCMLMCASVFTSPCA